MRKASSGFLVVLIISLRDIIKNIIGEKPRQVQLHFALCGFLLQLVSAFSSATCRMQWTGQCYDSWDDQPKYGNLQTHVSGRIPKATWNRLARSLLLNLNALLQYRTNMAKLTCRSVHCQKHEHHTGVGKTRIRSSRTWCQSFTEQRPLTFIEEEFSFLSLSLSGGGDDWERGRCVWRCRFCYPQLVWLFDHALSVCFLLHNLVVAEPTSRVFLLLFSG